MCHEQDNALLDWLRHRLAEDIHRAEYLLGFDHSVEEYVEVVHPQLLAADHAREQLRIIRSAENPVPF